MKKIAIIATLLLMGFVPQLSQAKPSYFVYLVLAAMSQVVVMDESGYVV